LVRFPLDSAIDLLPGNGTGAKPAAELARDRLDARLRAVIATILGDPILREDVEQRRHAAEERDRALRLRVEAERRTERPTRASRSAQEQATRQREQANQRAAIRGQRAAREQETEGRRAAKVKSDLVETSRRTAELDQEALTDRVREERLDKVNAKTGALRKKEKELWVRKVARRLRGAASRMKTERKAN
jgi:hypothetical protein